MIKWYTVIDGQPGTIKKSLCSIVDIAKQKKTKNSLPFATL